MPPFAAASTSLRPPGSNGAGSHDNPAAGASDDDGDDCAGSNIDGDTQTKAPSSGRHRKSVKSCPNTEHQPLPVIPSASSNEVVMDYMWASKKPLTDMREAVKAMCNDVRKGDSVARMRVTRYWWPAHPDGKTLWPLLVEVEHAMLNAADKTHVVNVGEKLVPVRRMKASRNFGAQERVADMLLMVEKEPVQRPPSSSSNCNYGRHLCAARLRLPLFL